MSGFSAEWLALREPVDHRSRDARVRDFVVEALAAVACPDILDFGCGSGSNLRALAPYLGARQRWRLVDHDPALLEAARDALTGWADGVRSSDREKLVLEKDGKTIDVALRRADLAKDFEPLLNEGADLVTAAAFFDLVGAPWIDRFCQSLAERNQPLYATLTYDGVERWKPPHDADAAILQAFHVHQTSDKGFGVAEGPEAFARLRGAFDGLGWDIAQGDSSWVLDESDAALIATLAEGTAGAVAETGLVAPDVVADWLASRRKATGCTIGHLDLFASPPRPRA